MAVSNVRWGQTHYRLPLFVHFACFVVPHPHQGQTHYHSLIFVPLCVPCGYSQHPLGTDGDRQIITSPPPRPAPPWGQTDYRFLPHSVPVDYAPCIADQLIVQFTLNTIPQKKTPSKQNRPHGDRQIISVRMGTDRLSVKQKAEIEQFHRGQTDYRIFFWKSGALVSSCIR